MIITKEQTKEFESILSMLQSSDQEQQNLACSLMKTSLWWKCHHAERLFINSSFDRDVWDPVNLTLKKLFNPNIESYIKFSSTRRLRINVLKRLINSHGCVFFYLNKKFNKFSMIKFTHETN